MLGNGKDDELSLMARGKHEIGRAIEAIWAWWSGWWLDGEMLVLFVFAKGTRGEVTWAGDRARKASRPGNEVASLPVQSTLFVSENEKSIAIVMDDFQAGSVLARASGARYCAGVVNKKNEARGLPCFSDVAPLKKVRPC